MNPLDLQTYTANLLLHSLLLSLVALAAAACFKNPHARSLTAALGLLALAIIPPLSAWQVPTRKAPATIPVSIPVTHVISELPVITTLPPNPRVVPQAAAPATSPALKLPEPWILIAGLWELGFAFQIIRLAIGSFRLARWKASLRHATDSELAALREISPQLPPRHRVRISQAGSSPLVTGFFRPTLILPEDLLAPEYSRELHWALRHETGHLRGHDLQWLALFQFLLAVFWWNPAAHRLARIRADAREHICDQLAVTRPRDRAKYGAFLVSIAGRPVSRSALAMADRGTVGRLKTRLHFLMKAKPSPPCGPAFTTAATLLTLLLGLALTQFGLRAETPAATPQPVAASPAPKAPSPAKLQFKFTSKFIATSTPMVKESTVFTDKQLRLTLRGLAQIRGTELMTVPSVTAKPGQPAMIEIIREGPENTTRKAHPINDPDFQFAGIRIEYAADHTGEDIRLKGKTVIGHLPGSPLGPNSDSDYKSFPWDKLRQFRAEGNAVLKSTDALFIPVGELEPGHHLTWIATPVFINSTGHPADALGNTISETQSAGGHPSLPPLAPFDLYASGSIATLDKKAADDLIGPASTAPPCFASANTEKLLLARQTALNGFVQLPRVKLDRAKAPAHPWHEVPAFLASYTHEKGVGSGSFWWNYTPDPNNPTPPNEIQDFPSSIGLVGDHTWYFELPSPIAGKRRLLFLDISMIPTAGG